MGKSSFEGSFSVHHTIWATDLANKQELAEILTKEMGKPITQSLNEINGAQNRIEHLRKNAERWLSEEVIVRDGATLEHIRYEPLGVIANISAWNFLL
jgi:acyl-CoA reductase-like NAD-dependent aldehyde dehydrogenase